MPTAKLDVCDIKFQAVHPDGVIKNARRLTTTVERTFFEKQPKIFPVGKFLALPFFKKVAKTLNTN